MSEPLLIERTGVDIADSPARTRAPGREPFRIGAVQEAWHPDPDEHREALARGIRLAAAQGARLVCLQELTLSPYFAVDPAGPEGVGVEPEELPGGPTFEFAASMARETGVHVHASLYERAPEGGLGFNTAIVVAPDGTLVGRTRKLHIPVTAGYYEDKYFRPGPADDAPFPLVALGDANLGLPTCWDQWFPELARAYSLAGADVLVYPTAIGSEPDHPDFDTEPLWERVIVANGIANGTFMVAVNRTGEEPPLRFYGSSFISDPYGRVLVQAPRDEPAVLVCDLDLDQRGDWLELFPFLTTRRPDAYARAGRGGGAAMSETGAEATMTCPKCGGEMHTVERNGVTIEQCRKCHGIFLDRGEFEQLLSRETSYLGNDGGGADAGGRASRWPSWRR